MASEGCSSLGRSSSLEYFSGKRVACFLLKRICCQVFLDEDPYDSHVTDSGLNYRSYLKTTLADRPVCLGTTEPRGASKANRVKNTFLPSGCCVGAHATLHVLRGVVLCFLRRPLRGVARKVTQLILVASFLESKISPIAAATRHFTAASTLNATSLFIFGYSRIFESTSKPRVGRHNVFRIK